MGALIEHLAGAFPTWLAPEQVRVISITDAQRDAAAEAAHRMAETGIRVHLDDRSETLKYKIAEGMRVKVPYLAVIGKREAENGTIAVSVRGAGEKQHPVPVPVDAFIARLRAEIDSRALELSAGSRA
jgi:threonyl-tRNA synthetase